MKRRDLVAWLGSGLAVPAWATGSAGARRAAGPDMRLAAGGEMRLAAAWDSPDQHHVGVLVVKDGRLQVNAQVAVPTRAHGLWREPGGTLLAVARRPGDWLLRWRADDKTVQWGWSEPQRTLNGHVLASADGKTLYTTETDLETGAGLIGVRDAATLQKHAEWPTHGMDPHELVWGPQGDLWVANGGIPSLPESGRLKMALDRMDSSLVRIDTHNGRLLDQWRLPDQRLSLRHLAWNGAVLGVALQAEHDDAARRADAPVLAVLADRSLQMVPAPQRLTGYGGDIAAAGDGFAVSCPRANGVAVWRADGVWQAFQPLQEACALADMPHGLMVGGAISAAQMSHPTVMKPLPPALRLDNHWIQL